MDLFNDTVRYICNTDIPLSILEDAFLPPKDSTQRNRSLGDCIIEKIIKNKIMPELNSIGGTLVDVPLYRCRFEYDDTMQYRYHRIYEIDPEYTQNRVINSVLRAYNTGVISSPAGASPYGIGVNAYQTSDVDEMVRKGIEPNSRAIKFSDAEIEIVGDNMLRVVNTIMMSYSLTLECRVGYSSEFHEFQRPYYIEFFKLANLAAKAYISRELRLKIDMFKNDGGRELGVYKDIVDEYQSAAQDYNEEIDKRWGKILVLADARRNAKATWNSGRTTV